MSKNELRLRKQWNVYSKRYNRMMEKLEQQGIDGLELHKLINLAVKVYEKTN